MTLTYGSVCSGIEAVTQAWHPLGLVPTFFAETDEFCSAVLDHHWPEIPNLGDFTKIGTKPTVDVLVAGTPCQSFSQAGGRAGLRDPRGILALEFLLLAARLQARWVVWENVPGVLFSGDDGGEREDREADPGGDGGSDPRNWMDFGTFLGSLAQLGFGFAYRILDAEHFGVPQRRRRVFVVGHSGGDWRAAAAVLLERESLRGIAPPRRTQGTQVARTLAARSPDRDPDFTGPGNLVADTLMGSQEPTRDDHIVAPLSTRADGGHQGTLVYNVQPLSASVEPNTLVAKETTISEALTAIGPKRRCDRGDLVIMPIQPGQAAKSRQWGLGIGDDGDPSYSLTTRHDAGVIMAPLQDATNVTKDQNGIGIGNDGDPMFTLTAAQRQGIIVEEPVNFDAAQVTHPENRSKCEPGQGAPTLAVRGRPHIAYQSVVRRLTPREYERLQGFPPDFTLIDFKGKPASDGRRYRVVGNSMAIPVMQWIGKRILMVEEILLERNR